MNIVVGGEVTGRVNGAFKQTPLHEVLDTVLVANGYGYRLVGRSLVIMKASELGNVNPLFESAAIPCSGTQAKDIVASAKLLASPQGRVEAVESANSLVVFDFPERVEAIRKFVGDLDECARAGGKGASVAKLGSRNIKLQFLSADTASVWLAPLLSKEGKITAFKLENELLIVDEASRLDVIEQMIRQVDRPRQQVRITSLIYDVSLKDMERLGINWKSVVKGRHNSAGVPQTAFTIDSITQTPAVPGEIGGATRVHELQQELRPDRGRAGTAGMPRLPAAG